MDKHGGSRVAPSSAFRTHPSAVGAAVLIIEHCPWLDRNGDVMIPKSLHVVNEGVAFLLELVALAGLCAWGFNVGHDVAVHVLLGIAAPVAMAVVWGIFCAPRAKVVLPRVPLLSLRTAILLIAGVAMYAAGRHLAALVFAVVVVVNVVIVAMDSESLVIKR